jgi:hypothetical protein
MPTKFKGPSLEEDAFSIGGKKKAPFKVFVDQQFTKENRQKLQRLQQLNVLTDPDHVDFSKIDATLAAAQRFSPQYEELRTFYKDLSRTDKSMRTFFPYHIQRSDGTYLNDGPNGITHLYLDMMQVQELRRIHDGDNRRVLRKYFHKGSASWDRKKMNADIAHYREQMRQSKKRRIEPTPNSRPRSPNSKRSKRSRSKSPNRKRKRSA